MWRLPMIPSGVLADLCIGISQFSEEAYLWGLKLAVVPLRREVP